MPFYHKEILSIAEGLYDQLLRVAVNDTIYPSSHQANLQHNAIKIKRNFNNTDLPKKKVIKIFYEFKIIKKIDLLNLL
jgi:hypothetical protein